MLVIGGVLAPRHPMCYGHTLASAAANRAALFVIFILYFKFVT